MKSWTLTVKEDSETGECYIEFTDEILKESGFKIGDSLYWIDNCDGSFTLMKEPLTTFIKSSKI
jgi:hypothetical protein